MRSGALACLLALHLSLAPAVAQTAAGSTLKVAVVEGEGAIHNIRQRTASEVIVQVTDEREHPVAGAAVALTLPPQGASGTFLNRSLSTTVTTDARGRGLVRGLRPNNVAGKFEIRVNVSHRGQTARATITQFNMTVQEPKHKSSGKIVAILAVIGAAAAGGAYAGLRKSGSTAAAPTTPPAVPPIGITPGTAAVGPPQ